MAKKKTDEPDETEITLVGAHPIKVLSSREKELRSAPTKIQHNKEPTKEETDEETAPVLLEPPPKHDVPTFLPVPPRSLEATGLSEAFLEGLCLKHLFQAGALSGGELSRRTCLPPVVIEELAEKLRKHQLIDIKGSRGAGLGRTQTIFELTEKGQKHVDLVLERDRYVGPAPVPFATYCDAVRLQSIRGNRLMQKDLEPHFKDLVLPEQAFQALGPAMNSGRSLFLYGPPGNGKTAICARMTRCFGGDVFVPHAVLVDDFVIRIFDATIHREVEQKTSLPLCDERWVLCARPLVLVGGDLTMEDLDLRYAPDLRYYDAPFQVKANCGVLVLDDFGRQKVSPKALLNRWIIPLENDCDFLVTHTGKKLRLPFDVFVVFSTNLDPASLVDGAFLRRVRYKIEVSHPDEKRFQTIFERECDKKEIAFRDKAFGHLVAEHYKKRKRRFNACEARDLLDQVVDECTYRGVRPALNTETIDKAAASYFVSFYGAKTGKKRSS